jgi:hypothetical protein
MRPLAEIEATLDTLERDVAKPAEATGEMLRLGEEILEHWLLAHDKVPTDDQKEGFRLLALHRQAAQGDPSFNACRETCRELAYHYNLITVDPRHAETNQRVVMMVMVARHLYLFVSGKMQAAELGEFCCSSRPLRANAN